jgi:gamma-glutamyl:cysteine ligase YbdK (ATP-grasp superfamily)
MNTLHAFAGYGVELEYMIVDRETLAVLPLADALLGPAGEVARGAYAWSNEIVQHLVELKNRRPEPSLESLVAGFQAEAEAINALLAPLGARLMPTGMHPWMDPVSETRLWPYGQARIYQTYHRVFDCAQHGQANLQSAQLNLPFASDDEFARVHAATRLLLPILPALAASSPFVAGAPAADLDARMTAYAAAAQNVPAIIGEVVPDTICSRAEYETRILAPMYRDIAALDLDDVLPHEWLNARGAIPRFDRNALEIRVVDAQECPLADLAIAGAAVAVVRALYAERTTPLALQQAFPTHALAATLRACIHDAEAATIDDAGYLQLLGFPGRACRADALWQHLVDTHVANDSPWRAPLRVILDRGPLARRILRAVGNDVSPAALRGVYGALCDCLANGHLFLD